MKFINFLTSRGFAIILLCLSLVLLVLWNKNPDLYSRLFLVVPALIFLSISFCTVKRVFAGATRRDVGFWGSFVFHIGLLTVIFATALGPLTRFYATVVLPQGVTVNIEDKFLAHIRSNPVVGEVPFVNFRLDWLERRYEEGLYPVEYVAGLSIGFMEEDGYKNSYETIRINEPVMQNGYQFLYHDGRLSPMFVLRNDKGEVVFRRFADLSNKSSVEDSFKIPEAGLTVYTRFFPEIYREGGKYGTRSIEPKNPAFGIKVTTKEDPFRDIWSGVLKKGERAEFGGMTLEFKDLKPVVILRVIKDPTYYGIFTGWVLIVAGLMVRYLPVGILGIVIKKGQHGTLKSPMDTVTNRREV
jgi:cytochrome c biogenesis protein ResB